MPHQLPFQAEVDSWLDSGASASTDAAFLQQQLGEQTNLALIGHRPNGEMIYVNPAAAKFLGEQRRIVLGTSLWPHLDDEWGQQHRRLMRTATPTEPNFASAVRVDHGIEKHYSVHSSALFHSNGSLGVVWLTLQDQTEFWTAQQDLLRANKYLSEANRDNEDFAYIVSHDLQEPLRKITTFGDRLKKQSGDALDEKSTDYLDRMVSATGRMHGLIIDLLEFSRVATRATDFTDVNLHELTQSVLKSPEISARTTHATVHVGALPTIDVDRLQIEQLFSHLIDNAIKFADAERPLELWIDSAIFGGHWLFSFRDNGIGFDQKYADDIFTIFQRLQNGPKRTGTGAGLAVCRRIVERHDGSIRAISEPGEGTTILINLPRNQAELELPQAA